MGVREMKLMALGVVLILAASAKEIEDNSSVSNEDVKEHQGLGQASEPRKTSREMTTDGGEEATGDFCKEDLEVSLICMACDNLDSGINAHACCSHHAVFYVCNAFVHEAINVHGYTVESGEYPESEERRKRYGNLFTNWNWDFGSKSKNVKNKKYGSTFNRWGWSVNPKRSTDVFSDQDPDYVYSKSSAPQEKRYGSTFNNWGWSKKDKRFDNSLENWDVNDKRVSKRYGSTFSNWNWQALGKRDAGLDKRYGSTFNRWDWRSLGKRRDESQLRFGNGYRAWGKDEVEQPGIDMTKRYGSTFNRWNWGKRNEKNGLLSHRYPHWEMSETNLSNDGRNVKPKRYGNLFGRLFSSS